ncbi:ABC transporter permease subunit [Paenibacillus sp. HJGM_3]|uniref:ABC transporter permease subunit n=1 Tax=Paenibacillus sp. HJGM_3 TaxID=3379816 RepID=UPI003858FD76
MKWARRMAAAILALTICISTTASAAGTKGKLVMGTSPDYPPYESIDATGSGQVVGLDLDIARAIAGKLGYDLEVSGMDFNGLIAALQSKRVDFVMSAMSVTEERKASVDFSSSYYVARNTIVSPQGKPYSSLDELAGKRVGAQLGSVQDEVVAGIAASEKVRLNKISDLIQELKAGRLDAAVIEDAVAIELTGPNPDLSFTMLEPSPGDQGYAIAFPKGSPLREAFDTQLQAMKANGELQAIIDKWFGAMQTPVKSRGGFLDFRVLDGYVGYLLRGVGVTLLFSLVSALGGLIWGTVLSLFKISTIRPLQWFSTVYTSVFRGTPLLLQLSILYFATPQLIGYDISPLMAAGLAFGLNSAAYLSETIRGGLLAVDKGQREAAMALGLPYGTTLAHILFPQAIKNILPAIVNELVALVKESSLVSVIGVADLMRRAGVVQAQTFRAFEPLLFVGAVYYVLVLVLTSCARLLERRLRVSD